MYHPIQFPSVQVTSHNINALRFYLRNYPALIVAASALAYLPQHPIHFLLVIICLSFTLITASYVPPPAGKTGHAAKRLDSNHKLRNIITSQTDPKYVQLQRSFALHSIKHKIDRADLLRQNSRLTSTLRALRKDLSENSFAAFRDRLLLNNQLWKQERELKMLRQAAAASGGGEEETRVQELKDASAKDIRALEEKLETLEKKHSREMAGRDGLEEKKERIVEELVNEIVADLEESQRLVEVLRARISQHDTEVEEMHNDWLQDNQKLAREVQRLKLAAKRTGNVVVEQEEEISNDMDKTLVDGLLLLSSESKRKATEVEEENATGDSEAQDDESSSDMGSPTSTIAGDLESIHALEEPLWTARKLGSLSERGTSPKKSP